MPRVPVGSTKRGSCTSGTWKGREMVSVLVIFLTAKTKYPAPKVKGEKVYYGSQFVEVSVPNWVASGRAIWKRASQRRNSLWQSRQDATSLPFPFIPCRLWASQVVPLTPKGGLLSSVNLFSLSRNYDHSSQLTNLVTYTLKHRIT